MENEALTQRLRSLDGAGGAAELEGSGREEEHQDGWVGFAEHELRDRDRERGRGDGARHGDAAAYMLDDQLASLSGPGTGGVSPSLSRPPFVPPHPACVWRCDSLPSSLQPCPALYPPLEARILSPCSLAPALSRARIRKATMLVCPPAKAAAPCGQCQSLSLTHMCARALAIYLPLSPYLSHTTDEVVTGATSRHDCPKSAPRRHAECGYQGALGHCRFTTGVRQSRVV